MHIIFSILYNILCTYMYILMWIRVTRRRPHSVHLFWKPSAKTSGNSPGTHYYVIDDEYAASRANIFNTTLKLRAEYNKMCFVHCSLTRCFEQIKERIYFLKIVLIIATNYFRDNFRRINRNILFRTLFSSTLPPFVCRKRAFIYIYIYTGKPLCRCICLYYVIYKLYI